MEGWVGGHGEGAGVDEDMSGVGKLHTRVVRCGAVRCGCGVRWVILFRFPLNGFGNFARAPLQGFFWLCVGWVG